MQKIWDAIIIGAGPAGASCAVWLRHLGLDPLLLEASDRIGGLAARNPFADIWTLTSPNQTGVDVANQMARQVQAAGIDVWFETTVTSVSGQLPQFTVQAKRAGNQTAPLIARTLVLATGVRPRGLAGPAMPEDAAYPGVIVGPGEAIMATSFAGSRVAILGGGDNAFENYVFVQERGAACAHIYARTIRAQKQFVSRVPAADLNVGDVKVNPVDRIVNNRTYDWILVFYGWRPNVSCLAGLDLMFDARGFVQTAMDTTQTNIDGLYAIGEVAQRMHPCVPTAMADGVVAAKAIERRLTAT
jgi:thioredoxin reductase